MQHELVQAIKDAIKSQTNEMHTALPGQVVSFDPGTGMATIKPTMQYSKPDGSKIDFPEISGVPVVFPQGAGQSVGVAFPVTAGDSVLLIFSEQALDYWLYGQETGTDLRFDLSSAIAIPGLFNKASSIVQKACSENAVVAASGGVMLLVKPDKVEIIGDLKVTGKIDADGTITSNTDVLAAGISGKNHTHQCPDGITSSPQ